MDIMETFFLGGSRFFFSNRCQCATIAFFFKDKRLNFHHAKKELFSFFWRRSGDFELFNLLIFFLFFKKFRKYDFTDHRTVEWWWYFHPIEKSISILG